MHAWGGHFGFNYLFICVFLKFSSVRTLISDPDRYWCIRQSMHGGKFFQELVLLLVVILGFGSWFGDWWWNSRLNERGILRCEEKVKWKKDGVLVE